MLLDLFIFKITKLCINSFFSGEGGQVIKVTCKKRSGSDNFVSCMRKCLEKEFPTESLGLGGVFCAKKGQLKIHVMPEFSTKPLELDSDVENWLNFYTMDSNFTCFSVFVSRDPVRPKLYNHKVFLKSFISIFCLK